MTLVALLLSGVVAGMILQNIKLARLWHEALDREDKLLEHIRFWRERAVR